MKAKPKAMFNTTNGVFTPPHSRVLYRYLYREDYNGCQWDGTEICVKWTQNWPRSQSRSSENTYEHYH